MLALTQRSFAGLLWALAAEADGSARELPLAAPIEHPNTGWLWLHFNLADARTTDIIESLSLPAEAAALLGDKDEFQQLHRLENFDYGMIAGVGRDIDGPTEYFKFLHFALGERLLVTARRSPISALEATRRQLKNGLRVENETEVFGAIFEHIVEDIDAFAARLAGEIDRVEDKVMDGAAGEARRSLGHFRRTAVQLHRHVSSTRLALQRLDTRRTQTSPRLAAVLQPIGQQIEQLDREVASLRERARLLQEEIAALLAEETNRHLRVLSILTILFLPPTFIGGLFGMNLKGMPWADSEHGFWIATALAAVSTIIVVGIMERIGVFGRSEEE